MMQASCIKMRVSPEEINAASIYSLEGKSDENYYYLTRSAIRYK